MVDEGSLDLLRDFSECCREELEGFTLVMAVLG